MGGYEICLPIGATNLRLVKDGVEYPIDIDDAGFTRVGEDGSSKILTLFGGTEFEEEILDGCWRKSWDTDIDANQAFTAIINTTNAQLYMEGEADVAGTAGYGSVKNKNVIPLLDELEITVALQVPIDDTGATADRDIDLFFILTKTFQDDIPTDDTNYLYFQIEVTEAGLIYKVLKRANGVYTQLFGGSTYDDTTTYDTGDIEAVIYRIVFHGKPGTSGAHMHVYIKQSDTIANAESETENQLSSSPYDLDDLLFNIAYVNLELASENTSYFDSGQEAKVGYIRTNLDEIDFQVRYDTPDANLLLNRCELWDGDPDSGGIRVYDLDHEFSGDAYVQNGLIRLKIEEATIYGITLYGYSGAYTALIDRLAYDYLNGLATYLRYPHINKILYLSQVKTILEIKLTDTATNDDDYYEIIQITLWRGKFSLEWKITEIYPVNELRKYIFPSTPFRFGYSGDGYIGDDDLNINGQNATLTDNFSIIFDDAGEAFLVSQVYSVQPDQNVSVTDGSDFEFKDFQPSDVGSGKFIISCIPFAEVANLFTEAEDATLGGGATAESDAGAMGASGNGWALLNAQNELVAFDITAGTKLPEGRYLAIIRAYDLNQVAGDLRIRVYNNSDAEWRNEENASRYDTLTGAWAYYSMVFDITAADVSGTNSISIHCLKALADANEIYVDYFLIVPLGNGESYPQDLAHNAMRSINLDRRVGEV